MSKQKKIIFIFAFIAVFLLYIKNIFFSLQTDEQYFMILSQKIAGGMDLFKDCHEIHQTSAVFTAIALQLKYLFTGDSVTGDMLYLKFIGLAVHCLIAFWIYRLVKDKYPDRAQITAFLFFAFTPKLSTMPDYALMQYHLISFITVLYITEKRSHIWFGLLGGLLTIVYPPFAIFSIFMILMTNKQDRLYSLITYIITGMIYFLLFIRGNILYVANIFGSSMHSMTLPEKLIAYLQADYLQIIIFIICMVILLIKKIPRSFAYISTSIILFIPLCICIYLHKPLIYNIPFAVIAYIAFMEIEKKYRYLMYIFLCLPLLQMMTGNQSCFICLRYLFPFFLIWFVVKDRPGKIVSALFIALLILPLCITTRGFYTSQDGFHKVEEGSLKGVYISSLLKEKIDTLKVILQNIDASDILIMDSDTALYNYADKKMNCPNVINTPVFNRQFFDYYDASKIPDCIIKFMDAGIIDYDGNFEKAVTENYEARRYGTTLVFLKKEKTL